MTDYNSGKYTFIKLIKEHQIIIPIIQRDYVQGRNLKDIEELRRNFITEIINALLGLNGPLSLGFVYGKVLDKDYQEKKIKSKEAIETMLDSLQQYAKHLEEELVFNIDWKPSIIDSNVSLSKFIPLDGQQRLTTLFLLHWYLIHNLGVKFDYQFLLKGFTYQNRKETHDFIQALIEKEFLFENRPFIEQIKSNTWFFSQWLKNPSVRSMIYTIDTIHTLLKGKDLEKLLESLNSEHVFFDFLDLVSLKQTDEIYIKMNARGKQLTSFENFKAWLQGHVKNNNSEYGNLNKNWEDKLDIDWLDLFWNENEVSEVDNSMMKFFQLMGLSRYASSIETIYTNHLYNTIKSKKFDERYINIGENKELFTEDVLNHIFEVLDFLNDDNLKLYNLSAIKVLNDKSYSIKNRSLNGIELEKLSQNDEIVLHGILLYGIYNKKHEFEVDFENFEHWLRIIKNLAQNTFIQGFGNYNDALKSLRKLSENCLTIESELFDEKFTIDFFYGPQKKEEIRKVEYFGKSLKWRELIIKYENHPYFNGQIGFFFDLLDDKESIEEFEKKGERLSKLFGKELKENYSALQATLLCYGDYTIKKYSKWSFIGKNHNDLRSRFDNWRKVFDKSNNYGERLPFNILKDLVNDEKDLNDIRKEKSTKDWRNIFIKNKALIEYCESNVFEYQSEVNIQLLKGTTFTGKSVDALLYYLHKMLKKADVPNKINEINGAKRQGNQSFIEVKSQNEIIANLKVNFPTDSVLFILGIENIELLSDRVKTIIETIFTSNDGNQYELLLKESEYLENQDKILNDLVLNLGEIYRS